MKPFNYIYFLINNLYVFYLGYSNSCTLNLCVPNSYFIFSCVFLFLCFAISLLPRSYFFFTSSAFRLLWCSELLSALDPCGRLLKPTHNAGTEHHELDASCLVGRYDQRVPRATTHVSFTWWKWCSCNTSSECIPFPPENAKDYWLSGALSDVC